MWFKEYKLPKNMKIAIAGTGYVGLSLSVLLSQHNEVTAVDIVPKKVEQLNKRISPIQDAGIEEYLQTKKLNLKATLDGAIAYADVSHIGGLIAAGVLKNPFDFGFHAMMTTTHKSLRGPRGALILSKGIVSNPLKKPEDTIENIPTRIDRAVFPGMQ